MKLSELFNCTIAEDYASEFKINVPNLDPTHAKIVGTMDGYDVWKSTFYKDNVMYVLCENNEPLAYLTVLSAPIQGRMAFNGIWSSGKKKGMLTALLAFLTTKLGIKLVIPRTNELTHAGVTWLLKLIKNGNHIKVTDQQGNLIDPTVLYSHWNEARIDNGGPVGDIDIFIESHIRLDLWGTGYRKISERAKYVGNVLFD